MLVFVFTDRMLSKRPF